MLVQVFECPQDFHLSSIENKDTGTAMCQVALWALVWFLVAPLPVQLCASVLGKAAEHGSNAWAPGVR